MFRVYSITIFRVFKIYLELWFDLGLENFARIMSSFWAIKLKVWFISSPSFFSFLCGFNLIIIHIVSCNGSTREYNLHFLDYGRRLVS